MNENEAINAKQKCSILKIVSRKSKHLLRNLKAAMQRMLLCSMSAVPSWSQHDPHCALLEDSVLAHQIDDSEWTEQGCNSPHGKEWMPDEVGDWAKNVEGILEDMSSILKENISLAEKFSH